MEECLLIDSVDLLVEDQDLLDADFDKLTPNPTAGKLEWLAEIDAAQGSAEHIARGSPHSLCSQYCSGVNTRMGAEQEKVLIDREGSIKWQRQRKQ